MVADIRRWLLASPEQSSLRLEETEQKRRFHGDLWPCRQWQRRAVERVRAPRAASNPLPCTQPPGELIPDYSLKSYLYADSSPARSSSWMNPQTLPSSCLVNISMWTPTTHFGFHNPQPELPVFLYPSPQNTSLSLSKLSSSL